MKTEHKIKNIIRFLLLSIPLIFLFPIFLFAWEINTQTMKEMLDGWYER